MANPQHEPTMEEILASIRKIISEDTPPAPHDGHAGGDVLDLTHEVPNGRPSPDTQAPANTDCRNAEPAAPAGSGDELFSDRTRAAMEGAVAELSAPNPAGEAAVQPASGESVEEAFERAVKEAFEPVLEKWLAENSEAMIRHSKPVIREWLDEHFPQLLENAVKSELARAARTRR